MDAESIGTQPGIAWVYSWFGFTSPMLFIILLGVLLCVLVVVANLFALYTVRLKSTFVWEHHARITMALVHTYLHAPYSDSIKAHSADTTKTILNETQLFTTNLLFPVIKFVTSSILVVILLATLLFISPVFTIVAFGIIGGGYVGLYLLLAERIKTHGKTRLKETQHMFVKIIDALKAIKEIKLFGAESYFFDTIAAHNTEYTESRTAYYTISSSPRYIIEMITFFAGVVALIMVFVLEIDISSMLPVVAVFASAGYKLIPSIQELFTTFSSIRFNKPSLDSIVQALHATPTMSATPSVVDRERISFERAIILDAVSFRYESSDQDIVHTLSHTIQKGEKVAIVGETGSGKSTLVSLLLGLLTPTSGRILIDDTPLTSDTAHAWMELIGYVPQHIYLLDDTIAANIAFGISQDQIDMSRVREVSAIAQIASFIEAESDGYDTIVGENGVRLSGGQRQRIGIARALYRDPEVLVLDEATSALDDRVEEELLKEVFRLCQNKTVIMITHNKKLLTFFEKKLFINNNIIIAS
jgi:ATP-binding cassette subfamily C protein